MVGTVPESPKTAWRTEIRRWLGDVADHHAQVAYGCPSLLDERPSG